MSNNEIQELIQRLSADHQQHTIDYMQKLEESNIELVTVNFSDDVVYFVIPVNGVDWMEDEELTNISASKKDVASSLSSAGSVGSGATLFCIPATASSLSTVGSAGSAACLDPRAIRPIGASPVEDDQTPS